MGALIKFMPLKMLTVSIMRPDCQRGWLSTDLYQELVSRTSVSREVNLQALLTGRTIQ